MSGINPQITLATTRLRVSFCDDIGNTRSFSGTGFWLKASSGRELFITNKHNVDLTLKEGSETPFRLTLIELELRRSDSKQAFPETKFFKINSPLAFHAHTTADVAIIPSPTFENRPKDYISFSSLLNQTNLADVNFFNSKTHVMDFLEFVGFPRNKITEWWDQVWNMPVARLASASSWPSIPFTHAQIKTSDVALVSGLSFSGSSGSPVFSHQKGIKVGPGLEDPSYVPPTLLGIMSGHWWDEDAAPTMFAHTGLSFYTRATSILELIVKNNL